MKRYILILSLLSSILLGINFANQSPTTTKTINTPTPTDSVDAALKQTLSRFSQAQLVPDTSFIDSRRNRSLEALGKELFFSKALSGNHDVACASCHHPLLGGGDGLSLPVGEGAYEPDLLGPGRWHDWKNSDDPKANGAPNVARHSPTIFNTGLYNRSMFADGRIFVLDNTVKNSGAYQSHRTPDSDFGAADTNAGETLLESQARFPVTSIHEMAGTQFSQHLSNSQIRNKIIQRFIDQSGKTQWLKTFQKGLNTDLFAPEQLFTYKHIQQALGAYQQAQIFIDNPWFNYLKGDKDALTDEQKKGAVLFFSSIEEGGANCVSCHTPPIFSDEKYHNIATPQFGRGKQLNHEDYGRRAVTLKDEDRFKFRTPSLLNAQVTAPYTHTGAFIDLRSVITHHLDPARSIAQFDKYFSRNPQLIYIGDLYVNTATFNQDILLSLLNEQQQANSKALQKTRLSEQQINQLIAFIHSLTDPCTQDVACLSTLIPDPNTPAPDAHRLIAKFSQELSPAAALKVEAAANTDVQPAVPPQSGTGTLTLTLPCNLPITAVNSPLIGFGFEEVSQSVGINHMHDIEVELFTKDSFDELVFTGGMAAGDINNDCFNDLYYATGSAEVDALYINTQDGNFKLQSTSWGINQKELSNGATFADMDGDGDLDLLTTNIRHPTLASINSSGPLLHTASFKNDGNNHFSLWPELSVKATNTTSSLAIADIDADEDLDVISTHWNTRVAQENHLWRNDNGRLTAAGEELGFNNSSGSEDLTWTGIFTDINLDGYIDIIMAADFENSQIFQNNKGLNFTRTTSHSALTDKNAMGIVTLDYDNDGDMDWFTSNIYDPNPPKKPAWGAGQFGNKLYENKSGNFSDVSHKAGIAHGFWGWGTCAADFNNDGWQDLFHVNGFTIDTSISDKAEGELKAYYKEYQRSINNFAATPSRLFINNADGTFNEQAAHWGADDTGEGRAAICFDYDRDGDVDIFISNHLGAAKLYKNHARANADTHFINISLIGLGKNTQAIGAKVYVTANGITQMQEVKAGGSFLAGSPAELHFGLGAVKLIEKIKVVFPQPHYYEYVLENIAADRFITLTQPQE